METCGLKYILVPWSLPSLSSQMLRGKQAALLYIPNHGIVPCQSHRDNETWPRTPKTMSPNKPFLILVETAMKSGSMQSGSGLDASLLTELWSLCFGSFSVL